MSNDERDERPRPTAPAWASVPTMAWQRVTPSETDEDGDEERPAGRSDSRRRPQPPLPPGAGRAAVPQQRAGVANGTGPGPHAPSTVHAPMAPGTPSPGTNPPNVNPRGAMPPGSSRRGAAPGRPGSPVPPGGRTPPPDPHRDHAGPHDPRGYADPETYGPSGHPHSPMPPGPYPPDAYPPGPYTPGPHPPGPYPPRAASGQPSRPFSGPPYPPVPAPPRPGGPHPASPYGGGPQSGPPYPPRPGRPIPPAGSPSTPPRPHPQSGPPGPYRATGRASTPPYGIAPDGLIAGRRPAGQPGRSPMPVLPPFALTDPTPPGGVAGILAAQAAQAQAAQAAQAQAAQAAQAQAAQAAQAGQAAAAVPAPPIEPAARPRRRRPMPPAEPTARPGADRRPPVDRVRRRFEPVDGVASGPPSDVRPAHHDTTAPDFGRPDTARPDTARPDLGDRDGAGYETFHDLGVSPAEALLDLGARITERPDTGRRDTGGPSRHSTDGPSDADAGTSGADWFTPKPHHAPSTPEKAGVDGPGSRFAPASAPPAGTASEAAPRAASADDGVESPTTFAIDTADAAATPASVDTAPDGTAPDDSRVAPARHSADDDTAEEMPAERPAIGGESDAPDSDPSDTVATEAMPADDAARAEDRVDADGADDADADRADAGGAGADDAVAALDAAADADEQAESAAPTDPEQILARYEWTYDPETLHEVVDDENRLNEIRDMLTAKVNDNTDNASRARLLSLRAVVSRILGDLHKALADAKLALAHAEATGQLRRIAICQARLANVLQWRGEYAEADRLFAEANSSELPDRLRGTMHSHAGRSAYDQGRYMEACKHFERALDLGKEEDPQLLAATELALDAVLRRVVEGGWGPYPRTREEILQIVKPPAAAMDERTQLWGFTDADGETVVTARYADIQPFRDGVAWVRRPESETWELIDEAGGALIEAANGYLGVSSFAGGLAWVSRDGNGRWIAIDRNNNVTISTGFDDVRPFRRGIAAVRRNGYWGAVDGVGRVVVPFAYDMFATALSDGRYIDGFSDEGLAVVQVGGRKGVVDRSGRTLVDPSFLSLVIHPVSFLMTDDDGRWGALDRKGRILIDPTHPSRVSVTMEIDRLLADARPVL